MSEIDDISQLAAQDADLCLSLAATIDLRKPRDRADQLVVIALRLLAATIRQTVA